MLKNGLSHVKTTQHKGVPACICSMFRGPQSVAHCVGSAMSDRSAIKATGEKKLK